MIVHFPSVSWYNTCRHEATITQRRCTIRLNVYSQELTKELQVVSKKADTGIVYSGVRMFLASPDILHHTPEDDDRSAITFWIPHAESFTQEDLARLFEQMAAIVRNCPASC